MSSLRDLLDIADPSVVPVTTYYGPQGSHQIWFRGAHCWEYNSNHNYNWQELCWCVPACCVCKLEIEIWGGGGGGSGACCCMMGWNGHSGQYNKVTLCASQSNINGTSLDGCKYCFCAASITCRYPSNGGFDGCKSWVNGPGLDNFCACGGCYGNSCCFGSSNYAGGCRTRINWMTGEAWNRWQTNCWSQDRACREYCCEYGKEYWGAQNSYNQMDCADCGNWCMMKNYVPTAPYMDGKFGTLHTTRRCSMATCGREATMWMEGNNGGISGDCWRNGPPGMGGFSADVFGRGCCCGSEGAAGLVKITWHCKT